MTGLEAVERLIFSDRFAPRYGWHDDHIENDGTPDYRPAIQQVRAEFVDLLSVIENFGAIGGECLQLGIGECAASHEMWRCVFGRVSTIDWSGLYRDEHREAGADTHSPGARDFAEQCAPYDFLFIDAGHSFDDVRQDYESYAPMVLSGGVIAFHDALPRVGYEEVEVWRFLRTLPNVVVVGDEVGTAWMVKT